MRSIFSLACVAFLLYIFTFYMDGEMGVIIIAFLLMALVISLVYAIYGRKRVKVTFDCDAYVKKGSSLEVKVKVEKEGVFPLPFIEITTEASQTFGDNKKTFRLSLCKDPVTEFTFTQPAVTGGCGEIKITRVRSCGFLGFVKLSAKTALPEAKIVGVIPEIPQISASAQLFRNIADAVLTSDNEDENDTTMLFSANTFPGYEHREYVPGDSMKRVNWKLSSKTNKLMVRLDEAASAVQPCIALDLFRKGDENTKTLEREERLLQSVFGLITLLVKQGIACTFLYHRYDDSVVIENVDNPDYPSQLLLKVLSVKPVAGRRLDLGKCPENLCACVAATTDTGEDFCEITDRLPDKENSCVIIPEYMEKTNVKLPLWYLTEDNNFKLVE